MRYMSVCVLWTTICALYSLQITGGKKTAAIDFVCWAGISPFQRLVDTYREHRSGYTPLWTLHRHTHTHSEWTHGTSGNHSYLVTCQQIHKQIHAWRQANTTTWQTQAKWTNVFNRAISLLWAWRKKLRACFSIKSFIKYQTLISTSNSARGNKALPHQPKQQWPHAHTPASTQTHRQQALNELYVE